MDTTYNIIVFKTWDMKQWKKSDLQESENKCGQDYWATVQGAGRGRDQADPNGFSELKSWIENPGRPTWLAIPEQSIGLERAARRERELPGNSEGPPLSIQPHSHQCAHVCKLSERGKEPPGRIRHRSARCVTASSHRPQWKAHDSQSIR